MASAFSHGFVVLVLGACWTNVARTWKFWGWSLFCSLAPDLDMLGFAIGVPYEHAWGHRGFTHSLAFAMGLSILVVHAMFRDCGAPRQRMLLLVHFFLVTASHGVLDAMTNGGLGIAFFAPFDRTRYFLPWRPIEVSPIGIASFFSLHGLAILKSEILWIWIPMGVGAGLGSVVFGRWAKRTKPAHL